MRNGNSENLVVTFHGLEKARESWRRSVQPGHFTRLLQDIIQNYDILEKNMGL